MADDKAATAKNAKLLAEAADDLHTLDALWDRTPARIADADLDRVVERGQRERLGWEVKKEKAKAKKEATK